MILKGIILAGGLGTRLSPLTKITSKQLLPVFDKPLIYFPLSTLMLAGIREFVLISTQSHLHLFKELLGNGRDYGIEIQYVEQPRPNGIPEALLLSSRIVKEEHSALILGDNLFHGPGLGRRLAVFGETLGAQIFGYKVRNPSSYGIVELNENGSVESLVEKPLHPKSRIAVPGLYFFDQTAALRAKQLVPSARGELEIIDLLKSYLSDNALNFEMLPRGTAWFDNGSFTDLHEAGTYVRLYQERTGEVVGDLVEIARIQGWIN